MSSLLFQNISGICASSETREILEQLNPIDVSKVTPHQMDDSIDIQGVQVDGYGEVVVLSPMVLKEIEAKIEFDCQVATAHNDKEAVAETKAKFEATTRQIQDDFKKEVVSTVETKTKELTKKSIESILQKAEEKKKTTVNIGTELNDDNQNTFIGEPQSICTETFLLVGVGLNLDNVSAINLSNFMRTRSAKF